LPATAAPVEELLQVVKARLDPPRRQPALKSDGELASGLTAGVVLPERCQLLETRRVYHLAPAGRLRHGGASGGQPPGRFGLGLHAVRLQHHQQRLEHLAAYPSTFAGQAHLQWGYREPNLTLRQLGVQAYRQPPLGLVGVEVKPEGHERQDAPYGDVWTLFVRGPNVEPFGGESLLDVTFGGEAQLATQHPS
jgi:hypothetical protein